MRRQAGFTYVVALFTVAVASVVSLRAHEVTGQAARREMESDLLYYGQEYRRAIGEYYEGTPGTEKKYPRDLAALLDDQRQARLRRPLRRLYRDPMTMSDIWGLVQAPDGGIMGVYSLSEKTPIKTGGFAPALAHFLGAKKYSDWRFVYVSRQGANR